MNVLFRRYCPLLATPTVLLIGKGGCADGVPVCPATKTTEYKTPNIHCFVWRIKQNLDHHSTNAAFLPCKTGCLARSDNESILTPQSWFHLLPTVVGTCESCKDRGNDARPDASTLGTVGPEYRKRSFGLCHCFIYICHDARDGGCSPCQRTARAKPLVSK